MPDTGGCSEDHEDEHKEEEVGRDGAETQTQTCGTLATLGHHYRHPACHSDPTHC